MQLEKTIQFHFRLFNEDGEQLDDSRQSNQPISFVMGKGKLSPAILEKNIITMNPGDTQTFSFNSTESFGQRDDGNLLIVPISDIRLSEQNEAVEIGKKVQVVKENEEGLLEQQDFFYRITGILNGMVCLDANHPLAGKNLTYEIEVLSVEENEIPDETIEDQKE